MRALKELLYLLGCTMGYGRVSRMPKTFNIGVAKKTVIFGMAKKIIFFIVNFVDLEGGSPEKLLMDAYNIQKV